MKNKSLQKTIKIALIILVVILITLLLLVGMKEINSTDNAPRYSKIEDMPNIETLINQVYGKYIKMENSTNEKYVQDIYVDLKYGLYEGEVAKKDFFNALIQNVAQMMYYQNVRIIDNEKGIEIKVICDFENKMLLGSYINGDINFYGHYESQKALANYKKTGITTFNIESNEVKTLIQNEWNKDKLNIGEPEKNKVDNYIEYAKFGINIYEIDEKVFNLLFDYRYKGNVVNGIKVGEKLENVIQVLGEPIFGSIQQKYIGYKGQDLYVFFNQEQISIYPTEDKDSSIVPLIKQYEEDSSIKKMVSNATDIWENYETYAYDEYTVNLTYPLQGLKFQFGVTENNGIIIYNNYAGEILENYTQENLFNTEIEIPSYIYFVDEDSVNEYERERNMYIYIMTEGGEPGDFEDWKYSEYVE